MSHISQSPWGCKILILKVGFVILLKWTDLRAKLCAFWKKNSSSGIPEFGFTDMGKVTVERMLLWYQHTARQESVGCWATLTTRTPPNVSYLYFCTGGSHTESESSLKRMSFQAVQIFSWDQLTELHGFYVWKCIVWTVYIDCHLKLN